MHWSFRTSIELQDRFCKQKSTLGLWGSYELPRSWIWFEYGYPSTFKCQWVPPHQLHQCIWLFAFRRQSQLIYITTRKATRAQFQPKFNYDTIHNIIQSRGLVPWPLTMSIIFCGVLNKVRIFSYYTYIQADTWKFGWSYNLDTVHKKHCS